MFHFPRLTPDTYVLGVRYSRQKSGMGSPIRKSPDQRLLITSPRLIADCYVLHRQTMPRHPPHTLRVTTKNYTSFVVHVRVALRFIRCSYAFTRIVNVHAVLSRRETSIVSKARAGR